VPTSNDFLRPLSRNYPSGRDTRMCTSDGSSPRERDHGCHWAARLRSFQDGPSPVLELLEVLKDDPEEYVRRSVANNLNDISKDHPQRVVDLAGAWWDDGDPDRRRLVRHALQTLIKQGNEGALSVLGYSADTPTRVSWFRCSPEAVPIGGKARLQAEVENPSAEEEGALVDFRVRFVKAKGTTRPKVFKGSILTLSPGQSATVRKMVLFAQHSTRTHYSGPHRVELMLNGKTVAGQDFDVL
jgi:3-methyladenine DNA glycosylase AlkC